MVLVAAMVGDGGRVHHLMLLCGSPVLQHCGVRMRCRLHVNWCRLCLLVFAPGDDICGCSLCVVLPIQSLPSPVWYRSVSLCLSPVLPVPPPGWCPVPRQHEGGFAQGLRKAEAEDAGAMVQAHAGSRNAGLAVRPCVLNPCTSPSQRL